MMILYAESFRLLVKSRLERQNRVVWRLLPKKQEVIDCLVDIESLCSPYDEIQIDHYYFDVDNYRKDNYIFGLLKLSTIFNDNYYQKLMKCDFTQCPECSYNMNIVSEYRFPNIINLSCRHCGRNFQVKYEEL